MPEDIVIPDILPPSDDGIFKSLLTHPDGEPVLRGVMSDVLDMRFVSVEVRNVEPPISDVNEKQQRYDVNCRAVADSGKQIAVEMQTEPMKGDSAETEHRNIKSRAIRGVCDLYANQPGRGTAYGDFEQSFQITFCLTVIVAPRPNPAGGRRGFSKGNWFPFEGARRAEREHLRSNAALLKGGNQDGNRAVDEHKPGRTRACAVSLAANSAAGHGAQLRGGA
jgi:hypothetical protein